MNNINILINAIWRGQGGVQQARRQLGQLDDTAKKGAIGFKNLAGAAVGVSVAIGGITLAAKTAFNALERGAGLELTAQRFDRLAESIGTTGDALREDLGEATKGMLSNAQQMALATDLLALGLTTTADQTIRLSRVATELNQDMNELTLALTNQSKRRFDQLGVSVAGFDERLQALKESGLSAEEAFTEAFLQQAEAQIERVGGKAGTAAGELAKMEAALGNVRDAAAGAFLDAVRFMDGFEDIEDATEGMNRLADAIERVGDNFDKVILIRQGLEFLTNPLGEAADLWESIKEVQGDLSDQLAEYVIQNEDWQRVLDDVADTLRDIEGILGIEIIGDMERAVEEAESFDRALMNANNTLGEIVDKLADVGIPGRGGSERGDGAGGREGEINRLTPGTITEQVNLFQGFQADLTAISERAEQERAAITEQYESQRTDIVENYARERAEEEADWLLQRSRQEEDFRQSLEEARERAAESEQEARSRSHQSLEDLERDHLERIQDIIENADLQLKDAASRLDASAVARIIRQRDSALQDASDDYAEQRREIESQLEQQLQSIRTNLAQRLADLQEFHDKRQEREDEDRAIRLQRLEEAHRRELTELDEQYRQRMQDLKEQIRRERAETIAAYIKERNELVLHHDYLETLTAAYQQRILQAEEDWWAARLALVGGDTGRGDNGTGSGTGGDGDGGGTNEQQPSRLELEQLATALAIQAGWTQDAIFAMMNMIRDFTDTVLAQWIEHTFDYDVPGYAMGIDRVPRTGLAMLHQDEAVIPASRADQYRAGRMGGISLTNNIYATAGMDENALTRKVEKVTRQVLEEAWS